MLGQRLVCGTTKGDKFDLTSCSPGIGSSNRTKQQCGGFEKAGGTGQGRAGW